MSRYKKKRTERSNFQSQEPVVKAEPIRALNDKQRYYLRCLYLSDQIFTLGYAGTGKTYLAASVAVEFLQQGKIKKIIICRPTVGADEELGFLPGNINNKMQPWTVPFFDVVEERAGQAQLRTWLNSGKIEVVPLAYMRGRTFKNAWVMLDEAQNITPSQIKMFLTRMGEGSKIVVNGDLQQSDLKGDSGLKQVVDMIKKYDLPIPVIEFHKEDIVRSGICAMWAEAFERNEQN